MRKMIYLLSIATIAMPAYGMSKKTLPPSPATTPVVTEDTVWVGKSDETKSCDKKTGLEIDKASLDLTAANIKILAKRKLHDNKMRIQMCGTDKGDMNGFLISKKDLEKALVLGFKNVPAPPQ